MVNCFDCIYDPMCGLASKMSKHTNINCNDFKAKADKIAEIEQSVAVQQEISSECIGDFIQSIDAQPTVEHIVHGHWVLDKYDNVWCSNCHHDYSGKESYYKVSFCAYCGAKMDEKDEVIDNECV